jgi:Type IV secretion-system coupling protein DNA-binding domain
VGLVMKSDGLLPLLLASSLLAGAGALQMNKDKALLPDEWHELHFLKGIDQKSAIELFSSLAADRSAHIIAFEVVGKAGRVGYRIGVNHLRADEVLSQVRACLGVVTSKINDAYGIPSAKAPSLVRHDLVQNCSSSNHLVWNINVESNSKQLRIEPTETSRAVLTRLASLQPNESVTLQWLLGPRRTASLTPEGAKIAPGKRKAHDLKDGVPSFLTLGRISVIAVSPSTERSIAARVLTALRTAEAPGLRIGLTPARSLMPPTLGSVAVSKIPTSARHFPTRLNVRELPVVIGWPIGEQLQLPGFENTKSRLIRPSVEVCVDTSHKTGNNTSRVLGTSGYPGDSRSLVLSARDALQHLHVLGPTGVGKSTLLLGLITADIEAGHGVVVIDPKGDLVSDVLARIPAHRTGDIVVLDPSDQSPVGLNVMSLSHSSEDAYSDQRTDQYSGEPELVADQVLAVIHGVFKDAWGPRTQDILHAALLTLVGRPGVTLCDLPVLLTNSEYRAIATASVRTDLALGSFWQWFDALSEAERNTVIAPVMNKLRAFLLRPSMRAVLGQVEPRFQMADVFSVRPKILLVSLAKGKLGPEASKLFGSLVVAKLWQEAQKRSSAHPQARRPVMAYIDEFQDYLHLPTDISEVLAQARGHGLGFHLAHQHLGQLGAELRAGVLANARSRVCFALPQDDARVVASGSAHLQVDDFMNLGAYQAYASLMSSGQSHGFASLTTSPPAPEISDPVVVRRTSAEKYGISRDLTESYLRTIMDLAASSELSDAKERGSGGPDGSGSGAIGTRRRS